MAGGGDLTHAHWNDERLASRWAQFLALRAHANRVFEAWRAAGRVPTALALDVHISVELGGDLADAMADIGLTGCLDHLLVTSGARLRFARDLAHLELGEVSEWCPIVEVPPSGPPGAGAQIGRAHIGVTLASMPKCPRCWKHRGEIEHADQLCRRCAACVGREGGNE
jgi:hypothetical protein